MQDRRAIVNVAEQSRRPATPARLLQLQVDLIADLQEQIRDLKAQLAEARKGTAR